MESTRNPFGAFVKAVAFAADKHRNQRRKDAEASPYINHPIALANVLANEGGVDDVTVLCAAEKLFVCRCLLFCGAFTILQIRTLHFAERQSVL